MLAPGTILPVSHTLLSLVEVWATPSLFTQVIMVPFAIVRLEGLNVKLAMATVLGAVFVVVVELLFP